MTTPMERMGRALETAPAVGSSELSSDGLIDARYRVTKRLGGGGMGEVYEVEHARLKRVFALKLLRSELSAQRELIERFDREARAVAAVRSDHVVSIVDSGTLSDGRPYFVMERLIGQDLGQVLASTAELTVGRAVNLGIDICLGLHAAHSAGLVHRDLKPENVFVTHGDDARERGKLLDFGVVKVAEQDHTRPGALLGTARYMAPEQVTSGEPVTPAADLFAVGVILYRCLAGKHPFAADTLERVMFRVMNDTPLPLPPHVPSGLIALIEQALAKQPQARPASALEFARALARFTRDSRNLEGVGRFYVDTALPEVTSNSDDTTADTTPETVEATSKNPTLARVMSLIGASTLLIAATLGVDRLLFGVRTSSTAIAREPSPVTSSVEAASTLAFTPTPPTPPIVSTTEAIHPAPRPTPPARTARLAQKSAPPNPPSRQPPGPLSNIEAAPSASAPSLHWFDPRNPYGR